MLGKKQMVSGVRCLVTGKSRMSKWGTEDSPRLLAGMSDVALAESGEGQGVRVRYSIEGLLSNGDGRHGVRPLHGTVRFA